MDKTNNLDVFMTDLADSIREATGETGSINAQSFSTRITGLGSGKQDKLVSGENIKTINGQSILGSGNIEIGGKEIVQCKATSNKLWFGYSEDEEDNGPLEPNKIYIHSTLHAYNVSIYDIVPPDDIYGDYTIMFKSAGNIDYDGVLEVPDYVL
jgi:hypothetical protein